MQVLSKRIARQTSKNVRIVGVILLHRTTAINRSNAEYTGFIRAKGRQNGTAGKTYLKNAALLTVAGFALRALGMVFRCLWLRAWGPEVWACIS